MGGKLDRIIRLRRTPAVPLSGPGAWRRHGVVGPLHWLAWRLNNARRTLFVVLLGLACFGAFKVYVGWQVSFLISWTCSASCYLLLVGLVALNADSNATRRRTNPDPHPITMLSSIVISTMLSNICVGILLNLIAHHQHNHALITLCALAILLSWLILHTGFGRYYCQIYYAAYDSRGRPAEGGRRGGFNFPGTSEPTQLDFFYLAFMVGLTYSSSDVSVVNRETRKLVLIHSLVSIIFYSTVVASIVNVIVVAV